MAGDVLVWLGLGWWGTGSAIQWVSAALARNPRPSPSPRHLPKEFSIVAPMKGATDASAAYVGGLQTLAQAGVEVLICVATAEDAAIAATRALWPDAPILVGTDTTFNPKMNNVRKGLEAASRPVVALCDAGIVLGAEELRCASAPLSDTVGLVLALKAAVRPETFAAELECAYINGHQARFLFAADRLGLAVASGGVTLMSHSTLQRIGNWRGFNRWIADDYSVTRSVRELGLATRLGSIMLRLPVGSRTWADVWMRQVRWARTRLRLPVWPLVLWEPAIGAAVSGVAGLIGLAALGAGPSLAAAGLALHIFAWLCAEKWFMSGRGLAFGPRAACAALVREVLAPWLMVRALAGRNIDWRGTDLGGQWRKRGDEVSGKPV
ncbi:ceramide glucosyltransferase [Enhydrobacter aerosaccus]|uniref:Ceramide glucosyltransferase n=1 Tax=Enhydrobacter aerosaccus TaxID=225324 RepID=A0A1T4RZK9_9HYPH|nr:glycosyltransferase [Enhydrobacter aerosaccus]SKA21413.1 ceramide glucosyltransferase [Enhydrobacter aerosaccus]